MRGISSRAEFDGISEAIRLFIDDGANRGEVDCSIYKVKKKSNEHV